tara:strand:- start:21978 stop:22643 length:666 start_codon:yes stop_codon:yes gene_type:complete
MKHYTIFLFLLFISIANFLNAQEESDSDYIEFNDRKNTVHGVYVGLSFHYGKIDKSDTYASSLKIAYVANQQFEVGFVGTGFYTDLNKLGLDSNDRDLVGGYGGLHLEPIFFSKSKLNLSFPVLIGGGGIGLVRNNLRNAEISDDDWKPIFVVEPGVNILYNISRYIQFEVGIKHRFSSKINLQPEYNLSNINGFSAGMGIKIGVFNMGRNRYKKNITDEN